MEELLRLPLARTSSTVCTATRDTGPILVVTHPPLISRNSCQMYTGMGGHIGTNSEWFMGGGTTAVTDPNLAS